MLPSIRIMICLASRDGSAWLTAANRFASKNSILAL
jgi:hypothetical protein